MSTLNQNVVSFVEIEFGIDKEVSLFLHLFTEDMYNAKWCKAKSVMTKWGNEYTLYIMDMGGGDKKEYWRVQRWYFPLICERDRNIRRVCDICNFFLNIDQITILESCCWKERDSEYWRILASFDQIHSWNIYWRKS